MIIEDSKKRKTYYFHCMMIFLLMFAFGFLPEIEPITHYGMQVLGVFLACVYGWMIGQYIWPSVMALVTLGFLGTNNVTSMLSGAYGHQTVFMLLWALIFCHVLISSGLLEVITTVVLSNKYATKGPWILCAFLCIAVAVGTAFCTVATPVTLFVWYIFYGIMEKLDIPKYSPYASAVLILIAICSYTGSVLFPFNPATQVCFGITAAFSGGVVNINYGSYILYWTIFNIIFIPFVLLFFKYILRIKAPFEKIDPQILKLEKKPMTKSQKLILLYIVILCVGMVLPGLLPAGNAIKAFFTRLGTNGLFVVVNVLMMLTMVNGKSLQDVGQALKESVPWDIYFLVATALTISPILTSEATGISIVLNSIFGSVFAGTGAVMFTALVLLVGIAVTNCINNAVTMTLLIPIVFNFATVTGANFIGICVMFCGALLMGVVLPSGSGQGALLHGNSEYLKPTAIYKYTISAMIPFWVTFLITIPLMELLF